MSTTDVYLDVDGVLNAWPGRDPQWGWLSRGRQAEVLGFTIIWNPELITRLNALAARPDVQFHWLTTWLHDAPNNLCGAIGLEGQEWPVLGVAEAEVQRRIRGTGWWKFCAVQSAASENRIVWIDDDLPFDRPACDWVEAQEGRVLAVGPLCNDGITLAQMDHIENWIGDPA